MGQHLVDDDLEEQRRDEREELHEQRGEQHMAERPPVAPDRGQEPAQPEGLRIDAGTGEAPGDEDHQRLHLVVELGLGELAGDARDGVDDAEGAGRKGGGIDDRRPGSKEEEGRASASSADGRAPAHERCAP